MEVENLASVGGTSVAFAAANTMVGQLESATQRENRMEEHHSIQGFNFMIQMNRRGGLYFIHIHSFCHFRWTTPSRAPIVASDALSQGSCRILDIMNASFINSSYSS